MAIDDYKVTNAEVQAAHVQAAPNTLTGTAQENKAVFDGYPELLKEKHNGLIDELDDALSEKADSSDVEAALAEKADIDDVDTALAGKVDKIEGKGLSANDYIDADKALVGTITNKVDKETGKGLSTNDYTTAEKMKLSGIAAGAEVNVQADWEQSNPDADDYIKNKPYIPNKTSDLTNDSNYATETYVENGLDGKVDKETGKGLSANDYTSAEKSKLEDIEAGAEVNVQSDWLQNNSNADDYIKNKPTLPTKTSDLTNDSDFTTKEYVDGKLPIGEASGSIASVKDGADGMPMKSLTANIVPTQSGSGTPSPDNVRPISGWTEVTVFVSPTEDEEDATTHTTDLGRTVYGGTLDVVSGVLTVTHALVDLGSLDWEYSSGIFINYNTQVDLHTKERGGNAVCSIYQRSPAISASNMADYSVQIMGGASVSNAWVKDSRYTSAADFKTAMDGVQLCYELAEPQTYQLTPQTINTLQGVNNVWADSGNVAIEYVRDIGLALDNLLPDNPTTDGTYTLVCIVSDGKATLAWQSSGASLSSPLSMSSPAPLNSTNDTETRKVSLTEEEGDSNEIR